MPVQPGDRLGQYEIVEEIGRGGMATVFKARQPAMARFVAVKVLPEQFLHEPGFFARFTREAHVIAQLEHRSILPIYDFGEVNGLPFIVMRYMPHGSLRSRLQAGPLPVEAVVRIVRQVAEALDLAHANGVIHRDLKPDNVLLDAAGNAYLTDFGIAKVIEATALTSGSMIVGTPNYMAPEQARSESVGPPADVYALGSMTFEMLAGRPPFDAEGFIAVLLKHASAPLPRIHEVNSAVPASLQPILERAMAKAPEARYAQAGEFAHELERWQQANRGPTTTPGAIASEATVSEPSPLPVEPLAQVATVPGGVTPIPRLPAARGHARGPGLRIGLGIAVLILLAGGATSVLLAGPRFGLNFGGATLTPGPASTAAIVVDGSPAAPTEVVATTLAPSNEVLASTATAACPPPVDVSAMKLPANPKSVSGGWIAEPDNLIPYYSTMFEAAWMAELTEVGLAEWDDKGNLVPELAAEVPTAENGGVSADGLTITWRLKDCLYWSDGQRITSKDVKFTWQSMMDAKNKVVSRTGYDKIESVDTPDDLTVVIKFKELFPPWPTLFAQPSAVPGAILPAHILEGKTGLESNPFIHQPDVSSGPFIITEWVADSHITLEANPNFYKGHPKLDEIKIKFLPDRATALAALQSGDIDWYPNFSESNIPAVGALEPTIHLKVVPGPSFEHYFFNLGTTKGVDGKGISDVDGFCPFRDERVRHAITVGIDRQKIVDTLFEGKTTVPTSQWLNSSWNNTDLQLDPYNPDLAMKLLDEAGYKPGPGGIRMGDCDGKKVKLSFNFETSDAPIRVDIALAAKADLKKIGIEFKPIHTPSGTFFATYADGGVLPTGKYDMAGYTTGFYPDPWTDNYLCDAVPNKDKPDGANLYHLCDPALDKLFTDANATADSAARKKVFDEIQNYIFYKHYVVMMYARVSVYGYTDRFLPAPFGSLNDMFWNAEAWDVK